MKVEKELVKEDLYKAVNGDWLAQAEIPDDKASTGGFIDLRDGIEDTLMVDVADMAAGKIDLTTAEQKEFIHFYQQATDFDTRNKLGASPLKPFLEKIKALNSVADLQTIAVEWLEKTIALPFSVYVSPDMKNTNQYSLHLDVPGLILPDKTYYEEANESGRSLLQVYETMSQQVLEAVGFSPDQASDLAKKAVAFDALIVPHVKSAEESADYTKSYNPRTLAEVEAYLPDFDFSALFDHLVDQPVDQVIVTEPIYFEALETIVSDENMALLRAWLTVRFVNGMTKYLSEDLRQIGSQYQLAMSGSPKAQNKLKNAFNISIQIYDQVVGDYYGKKYFGEKARADVHDMVVTMIGIYKDRLSNNDWLSQDTIDKAIVKLDAVKILVGYPDDYPDVYRKMTVDLDASFIENLMAIVQIQMQDMFGRYGKEVDRTEWHMSADTVNAYYDPQMNLICFPAAILQAPFYSVDQSRSVNYGGIGAVIAHEISHAFDNNGSQFDDQGNLNNWWHKEDLDQFETKAQDMIDLWEGIEIHGGKVNGKLTVSENIADAGGLTAALEAAKLEENTNLEAFFYNWARIWAQKARNEYLELLLSVDVHSPNPLRANMPVSSLPEFYETFNVQPVDGMYLPPEERVVIW